MLPYQPQFQSNAAFLKPYASFFSYLMVFYMKSDLNWPTDFRDVLLWSVNRQQQTISFEPLAGVGLKGKTIILVYYTSWPNTYLYSKWLLSYRVYNNCLRTDRRRYKQRHVIIFSFFLNRCINWINISSIFEPCLQMFEHVESISLNNLPTSYSSKRARPYIVPLTKLQQKN